MHRGIHGVVSSLTPERAAAVAGTLAGLPGPHPSPSSWAATQDIMLQPCGPVLAQLNRAELELIADMWGVPTDGPLNDAALVGRLVSARVARGYRG